MLPWRRLGSVSLCVGGVGGDDNKYGGEEQDGRDGSVPAAVAWAGGGGGRVPPSPGASGSSGGGCLAAECRRRSFSLRGKGGKRLLAEGTEVGKGPGQRPLPREPWRRARLLPLGDEEHLPGGQVVVGSAPSGGERGKSPQALQPCLRGDCPVVGRKVRG